jgi:hypothetical protein
MGRLQIVMTGSIAVIGCGLWPSPSCARTFPQSPVLVTRLAWGLSGSVVRFPGTSDRSGRSPSVAGHWREQKLSAGPVDGMLRLTRIRSGGKQGSAWPLATDRFTTKAARLVIGTDILPGWRIAGESGLSLTKRHVDRVPTGSRPLTMATMEIGMAASHAGLGSIALAYVDAMTRGRRQGFDRMAELLGGAPLAGRGLRLSIAQGDEGNAAAAPRWSLAFASMRRPLADAALTAGTNRRLDNRVELGLHVGF